ncbi:hypothetical protein H8E52_03200 [bacterium]|nr:hypothetical protein [bacterium]
MKRLLTLLLLLLVALPIAAIDVKPLAYSLLMPGMGEYSLGYKTRAYAHWAVEAGGWYGVVHYRNVGFDRRYEYEAYADVHWSEGRWRSAWSEDWLDHEDAWDELCASAVAFDESHITYDDNENPVHYLDTHFAPYDEDPQHYYENLGKYDWYRWGWDDYDCADDHLNPRPGDHRYIYGKMRNSSDDAFNTAHNILTAMLLARVVSLVDTYIILVRLDHGSSDQAIRDGWRMSYQIEDRGGFRLGMTRNW